VLSGLAVSITLNAIGQFGIYNAQSITSSNAIISWTMGSLGGSCWADVWIPILSSLIGIVFFLYHARSFDLMALGDETAISLGVDTRNLKRLAFVVVAMMCGVSVASCGLIGLVGFMVPHMVRFVTGTEHRRVFPLSFLMGGIFLVCMDILARIMMAPSELPIGILTALCGGPYFVWLLRKNKGRG
jgi:iron complex transport system permease protein